MHSGLKTLTWWWLAAMIGVCLAAGAAEARSKAAQETQKAQQEQARCQDQCTQDSEEKIKACAKSCPLPRHGKTEEYQACTRQCMSNSGLAACSERCEQASRGAKSRPLRRYKKKSPN